MYVCVQKHPDIFVEQLYILFFARKITTKCKGAIFKGTNHRSPEKEDEILHFPPLLEVIQC